MRVKMLHNACQKGLQATAGQELDVPTHRAENLIRGGLAERIGTAVSEDDDTDVMDDDQVATLPVVK